MDQVTYQLVAENARDMISKSLCRKRSDHILPKGGKRPSSGQQVVPQQTRSHTR